MRILKYRQSYEPGTPFRAWIYQIARNARVDHYRKTPRHITFEPEMVAPVMPKDSAQQSQEVELLHRALMQMPEEKTRDFDFEPVSGIEVRRNCAAAGM